MPESITRILSTRPLDAALLEQAARKGILIDTLSFIATDPIRDEALIHDIRILSSRPLAAVFTSMNAVEAVAMHLNPPKVENWRIFCIGATTRQRVEDHFGIFSIAGTAPSAAALAEEILRNPPSEAFFFCGDQRRDELPDKLAQAGVRVKEVVVYRTTQTPHVVKGQYDGIAFFSPSAVHSFFASNTVPAPTRLFAIGQTTADTIRAYTNNPVVTSKWPEKETLVQQMIDYFQNNI